MWAVDNNVTQRLSKRDPMLIAAIKNLNSGTFKGLIIADDIEKIHATLIGAVVSLTTTPSGNCIGNGNGEIRYSNEALIQAAAVAAGGAGEVTVLSWLE